MSFLPNQLKPYAFSYFTKRLDGKSDMTDFIKSNPLVNIEGIKEIICKCENETLLFTKNNEEGKIVYEDLNFIDFKVSNMNKKVSEIVNFFIYSIGLDFMIFHFNSVYVCLGRAGEGLADMHLCFTLKKNNEYDFFKSIFMNPSILIENFNFKISKDPNLNLCDLEDPNVKENMLNILKNKKIEIETNEIQVNKNDTNTIKYGKINGYEINYIEKELKRIITLEDTNAFISYLKLLIINMQINMIDYVEVRSEADIFMVKKEEDVIIYVYDRIKFNEGKIVEGLMQLPDKMNN